MLRSLPSPFLVIFVVCFHAAAAEVALLVATTREWPDPFAAGLAFIAFLIGPLLFLSVMAWRRRANPDRVHFLTMFAVAIALLGVALFAVRLIADDELLKSPVFNPARVPLLQWLIVLAAWTRVNAIESREKRRRG